MADRTFVVFWDFIFCHSERSEESAVVRKKPKADSSASGFGMTRIAKGRKHG
jgi:hypothetical protein